MTFQTLRETVLKNNLCSSCGICEVVCPKSLVTIVALKPEDVVPGDERSCGTCNLCADACPGRHTNVSSSEEALFGRTRTEDERWLGIVSKTLLTRATDPDIYKHSSSGGSTTALLLAAQRELNAKYLVVAARHSDRPWLAASRICSGKEDLTGKTQQSTYQLFPHLQVLKALRCAAPNARIAIVALPCQVQALRKLQRLDGPVAEYARSRIVFILETACSSSTLPEATERIITDLLDLPLRQVRDVRYRDGDYPGNFVVHLKNGDQRELELWQSVEYFKKHKTHRCLSCGDWMSGLADVSLCDGDPNIFMSSALPDVRTLKHGRMMVRTGAGNRVVERAIADKSIEIVAGHVDRKNLGLERKRNRRALYERGHLPIPDAPIAGYVERDEIVSDEKLLQLSRQGGERAVTLPESTVETTE